MPPQVKKSSVLMKHKAKIDAGMKAHANDETNYGRINLPPGITNGIARLTKCYFDEYKTGDYKGEPYFRAEGVVVSPDTVMLADGSEVMVKGQYTSIMIPVCDTKKGNGDIVPVADHVGNILNELRKLGIDTAGRDGFEHLEPLAELAAAAKPYFRFSTSQGKPTPQYPDPRIWENWNGSKGLEDYEPEAGNQVEDDSEESEPEPEPVKVQGKVGPVKANPPAAKKVAPKPAPEPEPEPEEEPPFDLEAVLEAANNGDEDANQQLKDKALELGIDESEVDNAESWDAVAEMIREKEAGGTAEEEPEPEEFVPKVLDVYFYQLIDLKTKKPTVDPKTKKPSKPVEVEIKTVDPKKKTCTVKNLSNNQLYKDVPFDRLKEGE